MTNRRKDNPYPLSPDDRKLWERIRKDVTPLKGRKQTESGGAPHATAVATGSGSSETKPDPAQEWIAKPVSAGRSFRSAPYFPPQSAPAKAPAAGLTELDQKTLRQLKKGRLSIDARIDLHGMTQMHAHAALKSFLTDSAARGCRIVLVITGKGRQSAGILRQQVPHWLGEAPLRDLVSGYRTAHLSHGGEGALYIRLRRRREG